MTRIERHIQQNQFLEEQAAAGDSPGGWEFASRGSHGLAGQLQQKFEGQIGHCQLAAFELELAKAKMASGGQTPAEARKDDNAEKHDHQSGGGEEFITALEGRKPLEAFPLIAQTPPPFTIEAKIPPEVTPVLSPEKVEHIARLLADRAVMLSASQMQGAQSEFRLTLDRGQFGIGGLSLALDSGMVTVGLEGVNAPLTAALAAAGQALVGELRKYYPKRHVRIVALTDEDAAERWSTGGERAIAAQFGTGAQKS